MQSTSPSSYAFKSYFICTNEITQNNYLSSSTTGPTILQLPISPPSSTEQQMMTPAASSQNPSSCEEERAYETPPTPTATRITRIIKSDAYFWVTDLIFLFFCETLTFSASPNKKSGKKKSNHPSCLARNVTLCRISARSYRRNSPFQLHRLIPNPATQRCKHKPSPSIFADP